MNAIKLSPAQQAILESAIDHAGGKIDWFPDSIKGGARQKVIDAMFNRALITTDGSDWFVAAEGYDALGRDRPQAAPLPPDPETEAAVVAAEATWAKEEAKAKPRTRANSKQAEVLDMLRRPEGATIAQICGATGWQAHTVRGAFAGAFKKKLGLTITSEKPEGGDRVYRVKSV